MGIHFHFMEVKDVLVGQKRRHIAWIKKIIAHHQHSLSIINFIFCNDEYLLEINKKHLNHNSLTDIITFDLSDTKQDLQSDIFISTERVAENAQNLNITFNEELRRVMVHGVLHLMGFSDKSVKQTKEMRSAENKALSLF